MLNNDHIIIWYWFIKIHVRRAAAEDILKFTRICVYVFIYLFMYVFVSRLLATLTTLQTWNLAHILPLTLSKNVFFCFFEKISSIVWLFFFPSIHEFDSTLLSKHVKKTNFRKFLPIFCFPDAFSNFRLWHKITSLKPYR